MTRARDVSRRVFAVLLKIDVENLAREPTFTQRPLHLRISAVLLLRRLADSDDFLLVFR